MISKILVSFYFEIIMAFEFFRRIFFPKKQESEKKEQTDSQDIDTETIEEKDNDTFELQYSDPIPIPKKGWQYDRFGIGQIKNWIKGIVCGLEQSLTNNLRNKFDRFFEFRKIQKIDYFMHCWVYFSPII